MDIRDVPCSQVIAELAELMGELSHYLKSMTYLTCAPLSVRAEGRAM